MGYNSRKVSPDRYHTMMRAELAENFPHMTWNDALLSRKRICLIPRWRVYAKLRALDFSLSAIGRVSGFDHSTVFHALRRLPLYEKDVVALTNAEWSPAQASPLKTIKVANRALFAVT